MKVLFVWSGLTGYMGDCWRVLSSCPEIDLKVTVDLSDRHYGGAFDADVVMRGLSWSRSFPEGWSPDVLFTVGWHNAICRKAVFAFPKAKKVCCFDMPWEWRLRKMAARLVLWRYLRNFDAAFVPGAASIRYARWLGFARKRVFPGLFSTDTGRFGPHEGGNGFLYVGRDAPEKGVDILRAAYELYRARGGKWRLQIVNGVQPSALGPVFSGADCFVLASRWEPWGVVLVEAAAAGLPVICTDRCGARHEVVKGNGIVVKAGSANALAEAMLAVGGDSPALLLDVEEGIKLARPYSCEAWANRVTAICTELAGGAL